MRYVMMMMVVVAVCALAACGVDEVSVAEQEIGGGPRGDVCYLSDVASCSTPTCRDTDCVAPRYWCCSYGEIGQPLGCSYVVDLGACGYSWQVWAFRGRGVRASTAAA